jgi:hypothetical protein
VVWTATTALVVILALTLQAASLHRRDTELTRREKALAQMNEIVDQLKKNNDERERRLRDVADNLEEMYRMMRSQMTAGLPPADPAVRQAGHTAPAPLTLPESLPPAR